MAAQEKLSQKCADSAVRWENDTAPAGEKGPGSSEFTQPIRNFDSQAEADARARRIAEFREFSRARHTRPI
jgi:hypothetical protein